MRERAGPAPPEGEACWLAVGETAARALETHWQRASGGMEAPILCAQDVHDALDTLGERPVTGCVVSARVLDARPRAALQSLKRRLGSAPLMVLDGGEDEEACRAARDLGVLVWGPEAMRQPAREPTREPPAPGPERADAPLPRADADAPEAAAADGGRFAAGCLQRIGRLAALEAYILRTLAEVSNAGRISLMLREAERDTLCLRAGRGVDESLLGTVRCAMGAGVAGRAAALGRPVTGHGSMGGPRGYRATAFVVLPLGRGRVCEGVVSLTALPGNRIPPPEVLRAWTRLARHAGLALRNARRLRRARALSTSDPLTRLPNRRAFERALTREMERARRNGTRVVVAILDVDHFKSFNDRYGHAVGDRVLVEVARRLQAALRETDLVARWGGEEFAVLLPGLERERDPRTAIERTRAAVGGRPFALGDGLPAARVTLSGGFALYPSDGDRGEALLLRADEALYAAKEAGRDRIHAAG